MANTGLRSRLARFSALSLVTSGLTLLGMPSALAESLFAPTPFSSYDFTPDAPDFAFCAGSLVDEGIAPETAAAACADALHPRELGRCVARIDRGAIAASDVLSACERVRRPLDLASCFNEIKDDDTAAILGDVLETCRRSLLPERFAECVVGLRREVTLTTAAAMTTCISATDPVGFR